MTTRILLIRHAAHNRLGRILCGRMAGVDLSESGHAQAARLAGHPALASLAALYTSPQPRARQTAAAFALSPRIEPALDEIDYGGWTGRHFDDLAPDPAWLAWNSQRAANRPPGGESMTDAQSRMQDWLQAMPRCHPDATVAAFTHADIIKAAACAALGLSLDHHANFDIDPASITTIVAGSWGMKLAGLNAGL